VRRVYDLGGESYSTQADVLERCRRIWASAALLGQRVGGADESFVADLFALHPEAEVKGRGGVAGFVVDLEPSGRLRCFWVERADGSRVDFSVGKCLRQKPAEREVADRVLLAMREAVRPQVLEARAALPVVFRCPVTGDPVSRDGAHIDHAAPGTFAVLVRLWLGVEALGFDGVVLAKATESAHWQMGDEAQLGSWVAFHRSRAVLRGVARRANLSVLRRGAE
jgi:hypothetical protein